MPFPRHLLPIVLAFGICGCLDRGTNGIDTPPANTTTVRPSEPAKPAVPVVAVDVGNGAQVINAFGDNLLAAEKTWVGKRIRQTGQFQAIYRDDSKGPRRGRHYFTVALGYADIYIDPAHADAFAGLSEGATITFEADVVGYQQGVPGVPYGIWLTYDNARPAGP